MSYNELREAAYMLLKSVEDIEEDVRNKCATRELIEDNVYQAQEYLDTVKRILDQEEDLPFESEES